MEIIAINSLTQPGPKAVMIHLCVKSTYGTSAFCECGASRSCPMGGQLPSSIQVFKHPANDGQIFQKMPDPEAVKWAILWVGFKEGTRSREAPSVCGSNKHWPGPRYRMW